MKYVEAPNEVSGSRVATELFLAGGISNCPNWQQELVMKLQDTDLIIFNPRRANFPMGDEEAGRKQIAWEWKYLQRADYISFWFPRETLCPITLFELGSWSMSETKLFVGCHPDYPRRFDVEIQLALRCPEIKVVYDLNCLAGQIIEYHNSKKERETGFATTCPGCDTTTHWTHFGSDWKCSTCGEWRRWHAKGWVKEGENPFS